MTLSSPGTDIIRIAMVFACVATIGCSRPTYMMIGGLAYRSIDGNIQHERYLTLFSDERFAPKLVQGARRHNQRVAQHCGVADATLPMTTNAKATIGER